MQVALGSLNASERVERERVARVGPERGAILSAGGRDAADLPVDLAELHVRPGLRLGLAERRVDRELHVGDRELRVAQQIERVRDPRVRGQAGLHRRHPVVGHERGVIAAEFDERVPDDSVVARRRRGERVRAAAEDEGLGELVAGKCERAEAARGDQVLRHERERVIEDLL